MNSFSEASSSSGDGIAAGFAFAGRTVGLLGSLTQSKSSLLALSTRFDFYGKRSDIGYSSTNWCASSNFGSVNLALEAIAIF